MFRSIPFEKNKKIAVKISVNRRYRLTTRFLLRNNWLRIPDIKSPKDNSKVHFTDDQNREYDGRFIEDENMFFIGFEDRGGFRFKYEVIDWHYLDDKNDDDAHVKHEASETAEQEIAEHK